MQKAYELAKKGLGKVSPNPCVGAVIVKNGEILAEGWHKKAGDDHAEIDAINKVKDISKLKGAELYVTLEPCCHFGKTPPCVNRIIETGIKEVFIGMMDPFPKVKGKGIKILKKNGIFTEIFPKNTELAHKIFELNQPFLKAVKTNMPYVIMKAGISLDGKIATYTRDSKWITSEDARNDSKIERSFCDCVVIGAGAVESDDPVLGDKLRVVIDKFLSSDLKRKVFRDEKVFVATTDMASKNERELFKKSGINFKSFGKNVVSIEKLLKYLYSTGVHSVFVEGGSGVHGYFYDAFLKNQKLIDKVIFYVAPKFIGGEKSLPVIGGTGVKFVREIKGFLDYNIEKVGRDIKFVGYFNCY